MSVRQGHGIVVVAWLLVASLLCGCAALGFGETADSVMKEGQQLYADKKYDEAITKFERALELDSTRWLAYVYLARCYMAKGGWKLAISNARLAYKAAPSGDNVLATLAEALLGGGTAALRSGQFSEAISQFVEYIGLRPTDARGYVGVGQAYIGAGNYTEALTLGKALLQAGFGSDASGALNRSLQLNPGQTEATELLRGLR